MINRNFLAYRRSLVNRKSLINRGSLVDGITMLVIKVVWRETKQLGLGIAKNGRKYIVVGRYRPAGNMNMPGYFAQNVAPLNGSGSSIPDWGSSINLNHT